VFTASPAGTDTAASKEDTKAEQCGTEETEETEKKQEYSSSPSI
jgi:ribosomal protein L12E/L44/L45/RPP1/RPP2